MTNNSIYFVSTSLRKLKDPKYGSRNKKVEDNKQNKNALFYSMLIATIKKMHITNV